MEIPLYSMRSTLPAASEGGTNQRFPDRHPGSSMRVALPVPEDVVGGRRPPDEAHKVLAATAHPVRDHGWEPRWSCWPLVPTSNFHDELEAARKRRFLLLRARALRRPLARGYFGAGAGSHEPRPRSLGGYPERRVLAAARFLRQHLLGAAQLRRRPSIHQSRARLSRWRDDPPHL